MPLHPPPRPPFSPPHTVVALVVTRNGASTAARIPLEFTFEPDAVEISPNADGDLLIHPLPVSDPEAALVAAVQRYAGGQGAEFAAALHEEDDAAVPVGVPPVPPGSGAGRRGGA